jgi:hypothetical protein
MALEQVGLFKKGQSNGIKDNSVDQMLGKY